MHRLFQMVVVFFLFVQTVSAQQLIPMGETVEIELHMPHYVVLHDVYLDSGQWLKRQDEIISVDGQPLQSPELLPSRAATLTVNRQGSEHDIVLSEQEMRQIAPFIKNSTVGVGTLTYIDPQTAQFGALGHAITDQALGRRPELLRGALYITAVERIQKSEPGSPGYKVAHNRQPAAAGEVLANELYGVFGKWQQPLQQSVPPAREIIHGAHIKTGAAWLQTTLSGQKVEQFSIHITEITGETFQFIVDDERLLEQAGGIVQGMSGSPILQGNQFIGAVTHMFVEQPHKGAAITIVEMIKKSTN